MRSRFLAIGIGALTLTTLAACGSEGGTGASTASTVQVQLSAPNYVTALPVATTTTLPGAVAGDPNAAGVVAGEQLYKVVGGDYLYGIAKKFCLSADVVAAYNAWPEGVAHGLFAGSEVKIPSGACAPGSTPTAPAATTDVAVATTAGATPETTTTVDAAAGATYTVVAGDYLSGIATKNGTTVDAIMAANGWTGDPSKVVIYAGLKIKLPAKAG
ncbi:MAG: LysM peptidoglycan-binding domain-containing protein [Ilumatobacteraceae bacterium]